MEIISSYIKNYYKKYKKYPSTKMKFYKYGRLLGKGAFGKVNLCLHTLTGRLVAIKSINKEKIKSERQKQKIKQETTIMETLSKSKNIVKIFETYETKKHICIVMEYICAGDLLTYIKKRSKLTEPVAKFIFKQIILGIKHIHDNNIIHRDIKLDNILLDLDNNIKICDFGVSRKINIGEILFEQCGTPAYIAPEILINKGYEGFGVDIWSAGVVLYAMLSGTVPFKGNNLKELHDLIINGKYKEIKGVSKEAEDLIKKILEVDPKIRIKTEEILNHPWLVDLDFNFWKNQNLFTNAEYILLAKSNVDYRNIAFKEDMIENFNIRNLDTIEENINKNINTKSLILAPFNTSVSENEENDSDTYDEFNFKKNMIDINNPDLKILNGVIKYVAKVRDLNRNYELNNNQEIDNGVVITPNESEDKEKQKENNFMDKSYNYKFQSRRISPPNEKNENEENTSTDKINEDALDMIQNLGYKKFYMKKALMKNVFNYATTSYNLIVKYCFS
jgi:serine/threonine protein kinase